MVFLVTLMMLRGSRSYLGGTAWYLGDLGERYILNVLFASSWGFHVNYKGEKAVNAWRRGYIG